MEREDLINSILKLEWEMFTNTHNAGGRASCQDDKNTFLIMRRAQAWIWSNETLACYLNDLKQASKSKLNLMTIKYARMMETTFPDEYEAIKDRLPELSPRVIDLTGEIMKYHSKWAEEASKRYPLLFALSRPTKDPKENPEHMVSINSYLRCELLTYSETTLELCLTDTRMADAEGKNLSMEILRNSTRCYGFESLDNIEKSLALRKKK